ncbi:MAG TPA: glycosyl hydrolase family 18 protein [Ktedonobacterales bacterium]|nr:glycosyl hydrolase family 18 protein [Ktedonobacterales bacterium]
MGARLGSQRDTHPLWPLPGKGASSPRQPHSWRHRLLRAAQVLLAFVVVVTLVAGIFYWRLTATVTSYPGAHFNRGQNAVWLEHEWAGEPHTGADYDTLAQRLQREQVSYVFAHVGPLASDGTIPASRAPNAADLAAALHARMPNLHILAWIGQVEAAGGYPASESINLNLSMVRATIAQTAASFVRNLGFDGVHYDIEPILNNNPRFLDLLDATRAALPSGAILSISAEKWAPNAHIAEWLYANNKAGAWWTSYYYAAVAAHVDQMVAMLYNTGMLTPQLYQLTVQQETEHILEAARSAPHPPQVLIGLPTYTGDTTWFHDRAENIQTGLAGVVAGLNSNTDTDPFAGVAIYRYALTTDTDWSTYDSLWLGK